MNSIPGSVQINKSTHEVGFLVGLAVIMVIMTLGFFFLQFTVANLTGVSAGSSDPESTPQVEETV